MNNLIFRAALVFILSTQMAQSQNISPSDLLNFGRAIVGAQQGTASPSPNPPVRPARVQNGASTQNVREVQTLLTRLGYASGAIDGQMGRNTQNAIMQFQAAHGLPVDGRISGNLLASLRAAAGGAPVVQAEGAQGPSFNCALARTEVERAICGSTELAALDRQLASSYSAQRAHASGANRKTLAAQQRQWLAARNSCGANTGCLSQMMRQRIAQLGGNAATSSTRVGDNSGQLTSGLPKFAAGAGTTAPPPQSRGGSNAPVTVAASTPSGGMPAPSQAYKEDNRFVIINGGSYHPPGSIPSEVYQSRYLAALATLFEVQNLETQGLTGQALPLWTGDYLGVATLKSFAQQASRGNVSTQLDGLLRDDALKARGLTQKIRRSFATSFQLKRFDDAVRAQVSALLPKLTAPSPTPIRMRCRLVLKGRGMNSPDYNSDSQSFTVTDSCSKIEDNTFWASPRIDDVGRAMSASAIATNFGDRPTRINLPPAQAEQFVNVYQKNIMDITFDAEMVAKKTDSPLGVRFVIRRTGPYWLSYRAQPAQVAYKFNKGELSPPPLTEAQRIARDMADPQTGWTMRLEQERHAAIAMAEKPGRYSNELFAGNTKFLWRVTGHTGNTQTFLNPSAGTGLSDLFDTRGAVQVAHQIGRPASTVFRVNLPSQQGNTDEFVAAYIAVPSPLTSYQRPAPPDADAQLTVDFAITRLWRLPDQNNSAVLIGFGQPVRGAYANLNSRGEATKREEFRFAPAQGQEFTKLALLRPRDFLAAEAMELGKPLSQLLSELWPSSSQTSFERHDEIAALATAAKPLDLEAFWATGNARISKYDFNTHKIVVESLNITYPVGVTGNESRISRTRLVRLSNVGGEGVSIPMPEAKARALMQTLGDGGGFLFRAKLSADPSSRRTLPVSARVEQIDVLRKGADPSLVVPQEVIATLKIAKPAPAAPQAAGTGQASGGARFDLLGIQLDQPYQSALAQARKEISPDQTYFGKRTLWRKEMPNVTLTMPLAESTILLSKGGKDAVAIFHEPLLKEDPVTGVARTLQFAKGSRPDTATLRQMLIKKYGQPSGEQGMVYYWTASEVPIAKPSDGGEKSVSDIVKEETARQAEQSRRFVCGKAIQSIAMNLSYQADLAGKDYDPLQKIYRMFDPQDRQVAAPPFDPLWPIGIMDNDTQKCAGEKLFAVLQTNAEGQVVVLRVLLTDPAQLAKVKEQAKAAAKKKTNSPTGELQIKL